MVVMLLDNFSSAITTTLVCSCFVSENYLVTISYLYNIGKIG